MFTEKNRQELEERGFTVVNDVIPIEDCNRYIEEYQEWLSQFKDGEWPYSKNSLLQRYNVAHFEATWRVRIQAKAVFSKLWKTDKLVSSFDAIAIGRPPEDGEETFAIPGQHWIHCDQDAERVGLHAYQGGVYLETAEEDDWTFHVIEKSHLYMDEFYKTHSKSAFKSAINKYYHIRDEDLEWFKSKGCHMIRVPVPKGGMVLWDSRLLHANARPIKGRKNPGRWRYAVFVSMTPAIWATKHDLEIKRSAYDDVCMTVHWSSQGVVKFDSRVPSYSPTDVKFPTTLPEIAKTTEAKQLSGVIPYNFNDGQCNGPEWTPVWNKMFDENRGIQIKPWSGFWLLSGFLFVGGTAYLLNKIRK